MPDVRNLVRAHLQVFGHVQGVFFRAKTYEEARKRQIAGWIRNRVDGTVEAVVQGRQADVDELIAYCRKGPPAAVVDKVEIIWEIPVAAERSFRILEIR